MRVIIAVACAIVAVAAVTWIDAAAVVVFAIVAALATKTIMARIGESICWKICTFCDIERNTVLVPRQ